MPMIVTYVTQSAKRSDSLLVEVIIVRVPRLESPNGVGIEQWLSAKR